MGPRHIGRGNFHDDPDYEYMIVASMGPRHIGRGNPPPQGRIPGAGVASMGPRHIGRGNITIAGIDGVRRGQLQWGRVT